VGHQRRGWALALVVAVLRVPMMLLTKRDWRGAEHLPAAGGCILAANHVSEFDPIPFGHFVIDNGRLPRFLGKAEVFAVPIIGAIITGAGQIPVNRKTNDAAKAFSAAVAAVKAGECVVVYPEGTISRDPNLWPMTGKSGAARIALTAGCPVIPCAQWGPNDLLAPYARRPSLFPRKTMHVWAGPPVPLSDLQSQPLTSAVLSEATARIMAAITELLERIRGEQAPTERFNPRKAGVPETGNPNRHRTATSHPVAAPEEPVEGEPT
jgi:1-acyl-sn-glycerol-3-phosphate acyltransferase